MRTKLVYLTLLVFCFSIGVYAWRVFDTGRNPVRDLAQRYDQQIYNAQSTLVFVGDAPITHEEIDFEFTLHTKGLFDTEELKPDIDLGSRYEEELIPLKQRLLSTVIERRLLFQFIEQDSQFDISNPARFTTCLEEWQKAVQESQEFFQNELTRERLKVRLCEKDIVQQYLDERIFNRIKVIEEEVQTYFEQNAAEFATPEQVVIRNIVVGTEDEARSVRRRVRRHNFAEVAREVSLTPESEKGGLLGPFSRGEMPSVFDVAFHMRVGEIRGVLRSSYGFHILLLEKKLNRKDRSLDEVSAEIKAQLETEKREKEYQRWLEIALSSIEVRPPRSTL